MMSKFKKFNASLLAACLLFVLIPAVLPGCTRKYETDKVSDWTVAVCQTSGSVAKSSVHLFNSDLEPLHTLEVPYAGLRSSFLKGQCHDGTLVLIPAGYFKSRNEKKVLLYTPENGTARYVDVDMISIQGAFIYKENLYTTSNMHLKGTLLQVDTGKSFQFDNSGLFDVFPIGDFLYLNGTLDDIYLDTNGSYLSVPILAKVDADLNLNETYEFEGFESSDALMVSNEDNIYLLNGPESGQKGDVVLDVFDTKTGLTTRLNTFSGIVYNVLACDGEYLYLTVRNLRLDQVGESLYKLSLDGQVVDKLDLDFNIYKMDLHGGFIYAIGAMNVYKINCENLKLEKSIVIDETVSSSYLGEVITYH